MGTYVKKWVPELKNVPQKYLHKPWELKDEKILKLVLIIQGLLSNTKMQT